MNRDEETGQQHMDMPLLADMSRVCEALNRKDDAMLWAAAKRSSSTAMFFEQLRNQVGFTTYTTGGRKGSPRHLQHHSALIAMPVVLPAKAASLVNNGQAMDTAMGSVLRRLKEWFENRVEISVFNAPIPYEEVCIWSPSVALEKLEQLSARKEPTLALPQDADFRLPPEAPRLAFFIAAAQQPLKFPELPPVNHQADWRLTSHVSALLDLHAPIAISERIEVLTPDFACEAFAEGLLAWIAALHRECGIVRWDATPVDQDLVILQISLGDHEGEVSEIPLRAHQVGLEGVKRIVDFVAQVSEQSLRPTQVEGTTGIRLQ